MDAQELELYIANLQKIHDAPGQQLHRSEFIEYIGDCCLSEAELIEGMEDIHLIENEDDPDVFFLTSFGFEVLENREAYFVAPPQQKHAASLKDINEAISRIDPTRGKRYIYFFLFGIGGLFALTTLFMPKFGQREEAQPTFRLDERVVREIKAESEMLRDSVLQKKRP